MAGLNTPALVLRHADYADYDRMVTLFTPEYGRIDAIARGCRRPKSSLVNAVEPFTSGEYQLYFRKDRYSIDHCQITESFYELRTDYDRLVHGVYWLKLLEAALMPEVAAPQLFMITLRALAHLNYSDIPPELLTAAYEMHLLTQLGIEDVTGVVGNVHDDGAAVVDLLDHPEELTGRRRCKYITCRHSVESAGTDE